ncbi:MAG TPA: DUF4147 domain-containing protein, partial [Blastocatellia bacterium]|nr:DUF4147 domain-containing protein [Blastocatellia bacterium]
HPVPDSNSLAAGNRIISMINDCGEDTLVFFLLSGGGSSLVESPRSPEVKLEEIQRLNELLVGCGAKIGEINTIRKMYSRIKGGRLGYLARRLRSVAVLVSDVNPGDLTSLASNPLLPEPVGQEEARSVIERYGLMERMPETLQRVMEQSDPLAGASWTWEGDNLSIVSLLDNRDALKAAAHVAEGLGYRVELDFNSIEDQYQTVAEDHINRILELQSLNTSKPVCLISGGEVSCPVKGSGAGGRNQEFVLYSATRLAAIESDSDITVLSCGTDGVDGNSLAAGAVAGAELVRSAINQGVDITGFFERSDTHSFFRQFGGTVFTGPTGNNVRDIRILLANPVSL